MIRLVKKLLIKHQVHENPQIIHKMMLLIVKQKYQKKDTYLQKIIDELRLALHYNNGISKNNKFVRQCTK